MSVYFSFLFTGFLKKIYTKTVRSTLFNNTQAISLNVVKIQDLEKKFRKFKITSLELSTIGKSVSFASQSPETNKFPKFRKSFLLLSFFFLSIIFGNVSKQFSQCINQFFEHGINTNIGFSNTINFQINKHFQQTNMLNQQRINNISLFFSLIFPAVYSPKRSIRPIKLC